MPDAPGGRRRCVTGPWYPAGRSRASGPPPTLSRTVKYRLASRADAESKAEEGVALARASGLEASGHAVVMQESVADTLLAEADRANASAIAVGSRGLGGLGGLLLGSVSHALLQRADRTMVIVPSPKVAEQRNEKRRPHSKSDD